MKAELGSKKVQWIFPNRNPPENIMKEMMGMVAKIAILVLWRNYSYKFGFSAKEDQLARGLPWPLPGSS